jgi:hypothetical protein
MEPSMPLPNLSESQIAAISYQTQLQNQARIQLEGANLGAQLPFDTSQILPMLGQHGLPDLVATMTAQSAGGGDGHQLTQLAKRQRRYMFPFFPTHSVDHINCRLEKNRQAARERRRRKQGQLEQLQTMFCALVENQKALREQNVVSLF